VLPLTFHVDYWDDLGWKDRFSAPAFTARQEWYARSRSLRAPDGAGGLRGLYTPQMIVDGTVRFSGARRALALAELARAAARPPAVDVSGEASFGGDSVAIAARISPRAGVDQGRDWRLVVALLATSARTPTLRGENAGETVEEVAIVRALSDAVPIALPGPSTTRVVLPLPARRP
jgi:hypothetical protein